MSIVPPVSNANPSSSDGELVWGHSPDDRIIPALPEA